MHTLPLPLPLPPPQLRQKPHAKMIGATLVASYSAPSSPRSVKSATLGSAGRLEGRREGGRVGGRTPCIACVTIVPKQSMDCPNPQWANVFPFNRFPTKPNVSSSAVLGRVQSELNSLGPRPKDSSPSSVSPWTLQHTHTVAA